MTVNPAAIEMYIARRGAPDRTIDYWPKGRGLLKRREQVSGWIVRPYSPRYVPHGDLSPAQIDRMGPETASQIYQEISDGQRPEEPGLFLDESRRFWLLGRDDELTPIVDQDQVEAPELN